MEMVHLDQRGQRQETNPLGNLHYEKFISLEEVSAYTIKKRMSKTGKENTSRYQCLYSFTMMA